MTILQLLTLIVSVGILDVAKCRGLIVQLISQSELNHFICQQCVEC